MIQGTMSSQEMFLQWYDFGLGRAGLLGVEDERMLVDPASGAVVAGAHRVLARLNDPKRFYHELSDAQVENVGSPHATLDAALKELAELRARSNTAARALGMDLRSIPVAPESMPQDISPGDDRYAGIAAMLAKEGRLLPALQVASVQLNLSCGNWDELLACYNALACAIPRLLQLGDRSGGQRHGLYAAAVGADLTPPIVESPEHLYRLAVERGWVTDPSRWYSWVKIKPSSRFNAKGKMAKVHPPLIEVRMLDAIEDLDEVRAVLGEVLRIAGR